MDFFVCLSVCLFVCLFCWVVVFCCVFFLFLLFFYFLEKEIEIFPVRTHLNQKRSLWSIGVWDLVIHYSRCILGEDCCLAALCAASSQFISRGYTQTIQYVNLDLGSTAEAYCDPRRPLHTQSRQAVFPQNALRVMNDQTLNANRPNQLFLI